MVFEPFLGVLAIVGSI